MSRPQKLDPKKLIGSKFKTITYAFSENEAILYSLSVGLNSGTYIRDTDPLKTSDFKYTYERDEGFTTFPTFATVLNKSNIFEMLESLEHLPESFDPYKILHATQRTEMVHPKLKPNIPYVTYGEVIDVQDKTKFSLMVMEFKSYEKLDNGKEDLAFINTMGIMMMNVSGFGYTGNKSAKQLPKQPSRDPDSTLHDSTFLNQALFYRLNGDPNPLHIDPSASSMLGFKKPILHGLCTNGIVAKCMVQNLLNDDPTKLKAFHCRLVGHVFPGEKYEIKVWKEEGYFYFVANVVERNKPCLIGVLQTRQESKL